MAVEEGERVVAIEALAESEDAGALPAHRRDLHPTRGGPEDVN